MAAVIKIVVETSGGVDSVKKDLASLGDTAEKAGGGFSSLREIAVGALREVGALAVNALGQAAQATVGFLKDSVSVAGDFQAGMAEFQAVAGKSIDTAGLEEFHDLFIQIGKDMPVSTSDVQKAAIELVKGGIDPATVAAGGLESAIKFAGAAMGGDLAAAAEVSAKVVGGWADVSATAAEKADLLTHSADLLTKAANASTVDVHDLALGLYNVQGTAKTVGLSLDETTTALAELAPRFSNANTAGTAFRNFLVRIQPSTQPAKDAMQALGLYTEETGSAFFNAKGEFVGVAEASRILQDATIGLTAAEKTMALQTIFGNDAMNAAAAFAEMGAQGYNNMTDALLNANGVTANAELKQQGFNTAVENVKGSIEALQITIGEYLLPVLGALINDYIAPAINSVTSFVSSIMTADDPILALVQSVDSLIPGLGSIIGYIAVFVTEGDAMNDFLATTPGLFQDILLAVQLVGDNLAPILSGITAMVLYVVVPAFITWATTAGTAAIATITALAPVVLPILAIGAAVGLLVAAWERDWGGIRTVLTDFWNTTGKPIFEDVKTWLSVNIPAAITTVSNFWTNTLKPALDTVWAFIKNSLIPTIADLAVGTFNTLNTGAKGVSDFWTGTLKPAFDAVWSFLNTYAIPLFQALANVHMALVQRASGELAEFWTGTLKPAFDAVYSFVNSYINPVFGTLSGEKLAQTTGASKALSDFWTGTLLPAFQAISEYLNKTLGPAWDYVVGKISDFSGWISGLGSTITTAIGWLNDLAESIRGTPSMPSSTGAASVPEFAKGVDNFAGGLAYVHAGEILMNLRPGTTVIPANEARQMMSPTVVTNNITNNLTFAPSYTGGSSTPLDYTFAKSLAGVI